MSKRDISIIIVILLLVVGYFVINRSEQEVGETGQASVSQGIEDNKNQNKKAFNTDAQCEIEEMIFYYFDWCSWCQKVKNEGTISKIEELGVEVRQINVEVGPVEHQFQGVPTFVIGEKVYSGYRTFEELKELLNCSEEAEQSSLEEDFIGEKGEKKDLVNGEINLAVEIFSDNLAHYYNTELPNEKTIYFFVIKDNNGVYRAAANACQVCFDARMGFRQEDDFMVCNTCGNKYPLEKIATEKGGCNPGPINPSLEVRDGQVIIKQSEIEEVAEFF